MESKDVLRYLPEQRKAIDTFVYDLNKEIKKLRISYWPRFSTKNFVSLAGFVLIGRTNGNKYRLYIDDSDIENAVISVADGSTPVVGDYLFVSSAYGPILSGRTYSGLYRFFIDDSDPQNPILGIDKLLSPLSVNNQYDMWFAYNDIGWTNLGTVNGEVYLWYIDDLSGEGVMSLEKQ
jgi:hypothetical protein